MAVTPCKLCVTLRTLGGDESEIEVEPECLVRELKDAIADKWEILPDCLKLILGADILTDTERLAPLCTDLSADGAATSELSLLVLISLDAVHQRLETGNSRLRLISLRTLARLTPKSSEAALDAISARLKDANVLVRQTAVQMMAQVADRGDPRVTAELIACTVDKHGGVRLEALSVLAQVAPEGDEGAILAACAGLDAVELREKSFAAEALIELAIGQRGNHLVVSALSLHLKALTNEEGSMANRDHYGLWLLTTARETRRVAVKALARLAKKGDAEVLELLLALCIDDPDSEVRASSIAALQDLADRGHEPTLAVLHRCLEADRLGHACRMAVATLAKIAMPGDVRAVHAAIGHLKDADVAMRRTALEALPSCAKPGDEEAIAAIAGCLEDRDASVRQCAVEALELVAHKGQDSAISLSASLLRHVKADVRAVAVQALARVANINDENVITTLGMCLEDHSPHVRVAAVDSLVRASAKGNSHALRVIRMRLEHASLQVRSTAEEAHAKLS
ncbi:unnamed protein product [Polarella glacialis]|uniref:Ubiquitin-like domain-containing protein n=1 Tax=Polarella glacialis TaxID=89957 RepID=A0A813GKL6_POLGL|nr:unnamed protein product [Polarella glacialis]CAE8708743.1 unnamed protein product [Polarella glacialis]